MFIKVEPAGFFMHTVKLFFDPAEPNSEDQQVRDYLAERELEPRYQWTEELEGCQFEVMQFGGCYLGRHLESVGQIQRRAVEVELLTEAVEGHLRDAPLEGVTVTDEQRRETTAALVEEFHQESSFQTNDNGELVASLDGDAVREAARCRLAGLSSP